MDLGSRAGTLEYDGDGDGCEDLLKNAIGVVYPDSKRVVQSVVVVVAVS